MQSIKKWLEPTKNKVISGVIAVLLVSGIGFGIWSVTKTDKFELKDLTYEKVSIILVEDKQEMNSDMDTVINGRIKTAYPDDFEKITILSYEYDVTKVSDVKDVYGQLDNKEEIYEAVSGKADAQEVKPFAGSLMYRVDNEDKKLNFEYIVVDTGLPIIEGDDEVTLEHDETFDVSKYKASDPVDGEIAITVAEGSGEVVDGQTTMTLVATDKNGNETRKEVKVTIKEEPVEEPEVETPTTQVPSNTGGTSSNTNTDKPSNNNGTSNNNNTTTQKPAEPSKPVEKPKEPSKPAEPEKPSRPAPSAPTGMKYYKDYGSFEGCKAVIYDVKKEHLREWVSNFCDDHGYMYYKPSN